MSIFSKNKKNAEFLKQIADRVGKEYESKSYEELLRLDETVEHELIEDGVRVFYYAELYNKKQNGDLCVSIDFHSDLPTFLGIKPAYQFKKRPDGSVYY